MNDERRTTRIAVALMLLCFVRALVPIAPAPLAARPVDEGVAGEASFACSQHECGCRSLEQCHRACCCAGDELEAAAAETVARENEQHADEQVAGARATGARFAIAIADRAPEIGARTPSSAASRARAILTSLACRGGWPGESWREARAPIAIVPARIGAIALPRLASSFRSDVRSLRSAAPRDPLVPPPRAAVTA